MNNYNVTFNVHFVDGEQTTQVIKVEATDKQDALNKAYDTNIYCMMFSSTQVTDSYHYSTEFIPPVVPNKVTIKGIDCYPKVYEPTDNTAVKFEDEEYDFICCDSDGKNWTETVAQLTAYAKCIGQTIIELEQV